MTLMIMSYCMFVWTGQCKKKSKNILKWPWSLNIFDQTLKKERKEHKNLEWDIPFLTSSCRKLTSKLSEGSMTWGHFSDTSTRNWEKLRKPEVSFMSSLASTFAISLTISATTEVMPKDSIRRITPCAHGTTMCSKCCKSCGEIEKQNRLFLINKATLWRSCFY